MNSGIYLIRNIINNKVYVGQTRNFTNRKRSHFKELGIGRHYNKYLQRSFNKYGSNNFEFEIIERCPIDFLNQKERFWIKKYKSEYNEYGYNASYAYVLFNEYDKKKVINRSKRTVNEIILSPEVRKKATEGVRKYWKNADDATRTKYSLAKTNIDVQKIHDLKQILAYDLDLSYVEIAHRLNIALNTVTHAANLQIFSSIDRHLNYLIESRGERIRKKEDKVMLRMWCEGATTNYIGSVLNINTRTVIRRLTKISNEDYNRCRLNVINYNERKRFRQIKALHSMGKSKVEIHKVLGYSRNCVTNVCNEDKLIQYRSVRDTRGINRIFKMKNLG